MEHFPKGAMVQNKFKTTNLLTYMQPIVSKVMTNIAEGTVNFLADFLADFNHALAEFQA